MSSNKEKELIIFAIFLSADYFHSSMGKDHLDKIAQIGGTDKAYKEMTFQGLDNAFQNIANLINPKFGLKLK